MLLHQEHHNGEDPLCCQGHPSFHYFFLYLIFHVDIITFHNGFRFPNLPLYHIPEVLYWIEIRQDYLSTLIVVFMESVWNDLYFVTWHIAVLKVAIIRWHIVVIKGCTCWATILIELGLDYYFFFPKEAHAKL